MGSLVDEQDRPFVLKKIWCHGQSILPPIIGIACVTYALREPPCGEPPSFFWMGMLAPLVLWIWPFVSWKAIVKATSTSTTPITTRISPTGTLLPSETTLVSSSSHVASFPPIRASQRLMWGGMMVLGVYVYILVTAVASCQGLTTGLGLLLVIFAGLAAFETMAFLVVILTCLRN